MRHIEPAPATAYDFLLARVRDRRDQMSAGHRHLAEFVLDHYDRAAFLTAAKLGQIVGVSESTVVRFAMALGYEGYPEFQESLQEIVKSRLTTVDRLIGMAEGMHSQEDLLAAILQADIDNIRMTLRDLDRGAFQNAVTALVEADRILVVGFRSAASLALFLGFNLNWILGNVKVAGFTAQDFWEDLVHLGPRDVVVGITFPRYTRATVQALTAAADRGCRLIAITDSVVSPLSRHADVLLTARHGIPAYTDSFTAPMSLINALLAAVGAADRSRTARNLRKLEDLWERFEVYQKD
jgi:DNA-binding MurR/RpiR family transcriptional regulator